MNDEEKVVLEKATTKEIYGAAEATEIKKKTLDELLAEDKELQSQYDIKVTKSIKTAKTKWIKEVEAKKLAKIKDGEKLQYQLEKEKKEKNKVIDELNVYKLKEKAIKIANCSKEINKILEQICR